MNKTIHILTCLVLCACSYSSFALSEGSMERWQLERLFQPSEEDLLREQEGSVFIYSGLKDKTAERALDEQFSRIESMMFVRTVITDEQAQPLVDENTGMAIVEEDGCND